MPDPDLASLLTFAKETAWEAGRFTLTYFQTPVDVEIKADASPVTAADRGAEERIVARIRSAYPDDTILGEEFGERPGSSGRRWILDPIDGTKSFIHGVPLYGTLMGLEIDGEPAVGVAYLAGLDEMYAGAVGLGATWNGRTARVSDTAEVKDATLTHTAWHLPEFEQKMKRFRTLAEQVSLVRGWTDCYAYLLVATGRSDVALDPNMNPWDCAALAPIVREAGGTFTDWQGVDTIHGNEAVATNGVLKNEVVEILSEGT